jgi:primosomal protein N' (replication factor Y)
MLPVEYIKVILPLALPRNYTFRVPAELADQIRFGIRVEAPLRNKVYAGIVVDMMDGTYVPEFSTRSILSVLDESPVITEDQFALWQWIASYYMCTVGEVMNVALPSGLKLSSETVVSLESGMEWDHVPLSDDEYLVVEALEIQKELRIGNIQEILDKKTVYPVIRKLLEKQLIWTREELQEAYKPRIVAFVRFVGPFREPDAEWDTLLDSLSRSKHQTHAVLSLVQLQKQFMHVPCREVYEMAGITGSVLNALEKKGIVEQYQREVSRLEPYSGETEDLPPLSDIQQETVQKIQEGFLDSHHALLHGVTGSGKTRIYQEFIRETFEAGGQVLYLLPEIGLTSQIVHRMSRVFGDRVIVFHSKLGVHERVEIWNAVRQGKSIVIGARSSLFLPFTNLKLIIVDEEHDASFKQQSPNPRYSARDVASYMASKWKARIIFGSATPSLESFYNAKTGKYTFISLGERHGEVSLPEIEIVNMSEKSSQLPNSRYYSVRLITQIHQVLNNREQVLLFQNRRGYSPTLICNTCGWTSGCPNCDISMTWHKAFHELRCHYCSAKAAVPRTCPQCGSANLFDLGLGTEKVEDELRLLLPEARIARMDLDTAGTKTKIEKILLDFELGEIDVLIGTQMITKGLDFERIGLVGIIDADRLIQFPDFRANERAFQLMLQVGGRAGRRQKQGRVIIQTTLVGHPLIRDVLQHDYDGFVQRELRERQQFGYPPFTRLIAIHFQHKNARQCLKTASRMAVLLQEKLGKRVLGPAVPGIARIRGQYRQQILVKMEKSTDMVQRIKSFILETREEMMADREYSPVRIVVDVDPF